MMKNTFRKKPTIIANWKMAMTIGQSRQFMESFKEKVAELTEEAQIIFCAPATSLSTLSNAVQDTAVLYTGAQNSSAYTNIEHSGELSAELIADTGCNFCMVGHWDMKVRMNKSDDELNNELHNVFNSGMSPIILVGESEADKGKSADDLDERMEKMLYGISPEKIQKSVVVYEPEWAIGADEPASPEYIAERASYIRSWLTNKFGSSCAQNVPIVYGGSVFPENAKWLLSTKDIDGLGAGRKSRDPEEFFSIVNTVLAYAKPA